MRQRPRPFWHQMPRLRGLDEMLDRVIMPRLRGLDEMLDRVIRPDHPEDIESYNPGEITLWNMF